MMRFLKNTYIYYMRDKDEEGDAFQLSVCDNYKISLLTGNRRQPCYEKAVDPLAVPLKGGFNTSLSI